MDGISIPERIGKRIAGKPYAADEIGMSGAKILVFNDCVLKIGRYWEKNADTVRVMRWLEGKLPAPKVLCFGEDGERQYLLMSRVPGRMACDPYWLERPRELLALLAEAMRMLWRTYASGCPRNRDLDAELSEARYRVENHLVNVDDTEPATLNTPGTN